MCCLRMASSPRSRAAGPPAHSRLLSCCGLWLARPFPWKDPRLPHIPPKPSWLAAECLLQGQIQTSSTLSLGWTSSRSVTQAAHVRFLRAIIGPPNLPRKPWGQPNARINRLFSQLNLHPRMTRAVDPCRPIFQNSSRSKSRIAICKVKLFALGSSDEMTPRKSPPLFKSTESPFLPRGTIVNLSVSKSLRK